MTLPYSYRIIKEVFHSIIEIQKWLHLLPQTQGMGTNRHAQPSIIHTAAASREQRPGGCWKAPMWEARYIFLGIIPIFLKYFKYKGHNSFQIKIVTRYIGQLSSQVTLKSSMFLRKQISALFVKRKINTAVEVASTWSHLLL